MTKELDDYHRGEMDCLNDVAHKGRQTEDYNAGYSFQYQFLERLTAISERQENEC